MDDLNKQCAEALGCIVDQELDMVMFLPPEQPLLKIFATVEDRGNLFIADLHFHDSFDWAMLLVKLLTTSGQKNDFNDLLRIRYKIHLMEATPLQISKVCLEVLK